MDKKRSIIYRCPVCFSRENDVVLAKDSQNGFYCLKCSFTGSLKDVQDIYSDMRKKYHLIRKRLTLEELKMM